MKKLLFLFLITLSSCHLKLSKKTIDGLVNNIENLKGIKAYTNFHEMIGWDKSRGNYLDTMIYQNIMDSNNNHLVKSIFKWMGKNENISYYYFNDKLIVGKIGSYDQFTSLKGTTYYFDTAGKYERRIFDSDKIRSEKEADVRKFLLAQAYSILDYFNSEKNKQ